MVLVFFLIVLSNRFHIQDRDVTVVVEPDLVLDNEIVMPFWIFAFEAVWDEMGNCLADYG